MREGEDSVAMLLAAGGGGQERGAGVVAGWTLPSRHYSRPSLHQWRGGSSGRAATIMTQGRGGYVSSVAGRE